MRRKEQWQNFAERSMSAHLKQVRCARVLPETRYGTVKCKINIVNYCENYFIPSVVIVSLDACVEIVDYGVSTRIDPNFQRESHEIEENITASRKPETQSKRVFSFTDSATLQKKSKGSFLCFPQQHTDVVRIASLLFTPGGYVKLRLAKSNNDFFDEIEFYHIEHVYAKRKRGHRLDGRRRNAKC